MTNRTKFSLRHHDFIVFIDGVEIPWLTLQLTAGIGQPSTASIYVEPDDVMERMRPKSLVHIFMADPHREVDDADPVPENEGDRPQGFYRKNYFLAFEGEVQTISESLTDNNVALVIGCSDLTNIINNTSLDLVQITSAIRLPMVNGSTFYGDFLSLDGSSSILNSVIYAAMGFNPNDIEENGFTPEERLASANTVPVLKDKIVTDPDQYYYHEAVRIALKYFTQFNASYRLQALRTRLFDKISGIADQTFQRLMTARAAQTLITTGFQNVPSQNLGQLMSFMLNMGLHHTTSMLFPVKSGGSRNAWSQYLFLPNMYYAIPPTCNWLFKENISTVNSSRAFLNEPTRIMVRDPMVGNLGLTHMAPKSLTQFLQSTGSGAQVPPVTNGVKSPVSLNAGRSADTNIRSESELDALTFRLDTTQAEDAGNPNLLKLLTPNEVEKGILLRVSDFSIEYFAATDVIRGAFGANVDGEADNDRRTRLNQQVEKAVTEQSDYIKYMQNLVNYRLVLEQLSRDISISGPFNPWATPGFPAVICRPDRSYRALLTQVTHTIRATGATQTLYNFALTTLFRPKTGIVDEGQIRQKKEALESTAVKKDDELQTAIAAFNNQVDFSIDEDDLDNTTAIIEKTTPAQVQTENVTRYVRNVEQDSNWISRYDFQPLIKSMRRATRALGTPQPLSRIVDAMVALDKQIRDTRGLIKSRKGTVSSYESVDGVLTKTTKETDFNPRLDAHLRLVDHLHNYSAFNPVGTVTNTGVGQTSVPVQTWVTQRNSSLKNVVYWNGTDPKGVAGAEKGPFTEFVDESDFKALETPFYNLLNSWNETFKDVIVVGRFTDMVRYGMFTVRLSLPADANENDDPTLVTINAWRDLVDFLIDEFLARATLIDLSGALEDLRQLRQSRNDARDQAQFFLDGIEETIEQVPIFDFANLSLLNPEAVEEVYEPVLGPSTRLKNVAPTELSVAGSNETLARIQARNKFLNMALKVYSFSEEQTPARGSQANQTNESGSAPLYSQWQNEGDIHKRINEFARRDYTAMVSLDDFLQINGLQLRTETASFGPMQRTFFRMRSERAVSYFDKIQPVSGTTGVTEAEQDINDLRKVYPPSKAPFLYEGGRQAVIVEYSKRHFVSRGLSGK